MAAEKFDYQKGKTLDQSVGTSKDFDLCSTHLFDVANFPITTWVIALCRDLNQSITHKHLDVLSQKVHEMHFVNRRKHTMQDINI